MSEASLSVAVVDPLQLRREVTILACKHIGFAGVGFVSVADYAAAEVSVDVVLYFPCITDVTRILASVALLREQGKPILVVSENNFNNEKMALRALIVGGAQGYLPSASSDMATAAAAIRFVAEGGTYAPMAKLLADGKKKTEDDDAEPELTPRQREVLELLRIGKPNKLIAYELNMSESTVKVHLRNLMSRLGATNRTQAVYKAQLLAA